MEISEKQHKLFNKILEKNRGLSPQMYGGKYHNKKVEYDGIKFDSTKEKDYYIILQSLLKCGFIKDLKRQEPYELIPTYKINNRTVRKMQYIADFTYITTKDNKLHVVDTKGYRTEVYKLKKKLFEYKYNMEIEEI